MADRILIMDNEKDVARLLESLLEQEGFKVETVDDGEKGLESVREDPPAIVILDLMEPDVEGREIVRALRKQARTEHIPVIFLTAKATEEDRVVGFELGCDDYVAKPFNPRELVLRVQAIERRLNPPDSTSEMIEVADLTIDTSRHVVKLGGRQVDLTPTEFKLLIYLIRRKYRVQTRETLLKQVWGQTLTGTEAAKNEKTRTVDTHIRRLRQKLGHMEYTIQTVRGVGYIFKPPATGLVGGPGYKYDEDDSVENLEEAAQT